ncbi:spermine synthase-like [Dysidea avara]|uniref:spermine synthase-like n=1 Tax=Dysidea avara TaxID=196820 RepID=UPI0033318050
MASLTHDILQFRLQAYSETVAKSTLKDIEQILLRYGLQDQVIETIQSSVKAMSILITENGRYTIEVYQSGLVCVDAVQSTEDPLIKDLSAVETVISETVLAKIPQVKFSIQKGTSLVRYCTRYDGQVDQYSFTSQLYSACSPYQQIDIFQSDEYGAILFLDNVVNIADSDEVYTKTLTGGGQYDMKDSKILILGGGDGAALREVLMYNPSMVIMIEIDKIVMDAVKRHMRSVCGDVLDEMKGDNYEIIIDDCIPVMKDFIKKGDVFDYIIHDTTDIPINVTLTDNVWELLHTILDLALKLLSSSGRCIVQGHGSHDHSAQKMFQHHLTNLHCAVDYSTVTVPVLSFKEDWTFYKVWKT